MSTGLPANRSAARNTSSAVTCCMSMKKLGSILDGGGWRFLGRQRGTRNRATTRPNRAANIATQGLDWHGTKPLGAGGCREAAPTSPEGPRPYMVNEVVSSPPLNQRLGSVLLQGSSCVDRDRKPDFWRLPCTIEHVIAGALMPSLSSWLARNIISRAGTS